MAPNFFDIYRRLEPLPLGRQLSTRLLRVAAPYFLTVPVSITALEPGHGSARMRHAPWVRNHLGTVHAISLCNLAELVMGATAEATVPESHRWVPSGMQVEYKSLARGTMHADAALTLPDPMPDRDTVPVAVEVTDDDHEVVFSASIDLWITRKAASAA